MSDTFVLDITITYILFTLKSRRNLWFFFHSYSDILPSFETLCILGLRSNLVFKSQFQCDIRPLVILMQSVTHIPIPRPILIPSSILQGFRLSMHIDIWDNQLCEPVTTIKSLCYLTLFIPLAYILHVSCGDGKPTRRIHEYFYVRNSTNDHVIYDNVWLVIRCR